DHPRLSVAGLDDPGPPGSSRARLPARPRTGREKTAAARPESVGSSEKVVELPEDGAQLSEPEGRVLRPARKATRPPLRHPRKQKAAGRAWQARPAETDFRVVSLVLAYWSSAAPSGGPSWWCMWAIMASSFSFWAGLRILATFSWNSWWAASASARSLWAEIARLPTVTASAFASRAFSRSWWSPFNCSWSGLTVANIWSARACTEAFCLASRSRCLASMSAIGGGPSPWLHILCPCPKSLPHPPRAAREAGTTRASTATSVSHFFMGDVSFSCASRESGRYVQRSPGSRWAALASAEDGRRRSTSESSSGRKATVKDVKPRRRR